MYSTIKTILLMIVYTITALLAGNIIYCQDDIHDVIHFVQEDSNWQFFFSKEKKVFRLDISDELRQMVGLLGALRNAQAIDILTEKLFQPSSLSRNPPRGYELYPCILATARHDSATLDFVLKKCKNGYDPFIVEGYFGSLMPNHSIETIIDDFIEKNKITLQDNQIKNLLLLKDFFITDTSRRSDIPPISRYVLNHPLYKKRISEIEMGLNIINKFKKDDVSQIKFFQAVHKLGELRAIEAVDILTPYLLFQSKTEPEKLDEKYSSIKKYPVAVSLAEIGIPSIRGLLKEIAKEHDEPEYIETAYKTMSAILPSVAILGFVDEAINNEQDEKAKERLEKLYPLLPQQEEIKKRVKEKPNRK